jgi:uncharacterized RDD family membrane protein YckC
MIIAAYILILLSIGFGLNAITGGIALLSSPLAVDALSFVVLVLPVILYFALQEGSSHQATFGKHRMKLKVVNLQGSRLRPWQTLLRSVLKFLPWQLAHTSVINMWLGNQALIFMVGALAAQGLVIIYMLGIWLNRKHQAPYDLAAGTCVISTE